MIKPKLILPGDVFSTKNSRFKWYMGKNAQKGMRRYKLLLDSQQCKDIWNSMIVGKHYPLTLSFKIYRSTERRFDYINMIQGACDALVKANYIEDDSYPYLLPVFEPTELDRENPRLEIEIL